MANVGLVIYRLLRFYELLILIHCIMSWLPYNVPGWVDDLRGALSAICEPFLGIFRRLPLQSGGLDFSPVVAILALTLVENLILRAFF